ncbi:MAG: zinc ABC transporter solute-binding protein [Nitrospinaceae bacterium]|nr:zinc ABC transporter solute-binding protein [Nitrospinaceae bacterium]
MIRFYALFLIFSFLVFGQPAAHGGDAPRVAVSIKPIHSLVAGVMKGSGEPALILRGGASPHTYSLKPSGMRVLQRARLVFWVGPELEAFLRKPLANLSGGSRAIALSRVEEISAGGHASESHRRRGDRHGDRHGHSNAEADMHIWLDPVNARRMVKVIEKELSRADEARAALYHTNASKLTRKLKILESSIRILLGSVVGVPYIVFHDAYRVFESRFGLRPLGALTLSPGRSPGAKRLAAIRRSTRLIWRLMCRAVSGTCWPRPAMARWTSMSMKPRWLRRALVRSEC